ncbi:MAG: hypothetical protein JXQ89_19465 [Pelagimonas sp.]
MEKKAKVLPLAIGVNRDCSGEPLVEVPGHGFLGPLSGLEHLIAEYKDCEIARQAVIASKGSA